MKKKRGRPKGKSGMQQLLCRLHAIHVESMYLSGMTCLQIARKLGVTRQRVHQVLDRYDLSTGERHERHGRGDTSKAAVEERRHRARWASYLAKVVPGEVLRRCFDLAPTDRLGAGSGRKAWNYPPHERAADLFNEGFKASDIAHHFGWTNIGPCLSKARKLGLLKRETRALWGSPGEPERVATSAGFAFACRHAEGGEALDAEAFAVGPFSAGIELAKRYLSIGGAA